MNFKTRCVGAVWDEDASEWIVTLENTETADQMMVVKCDVLVSAVGRLNNWKLPDIKGLDGFLGPVLHTANWPKDFQYAGKDIAIIGNGASAVQCLAAMSQGNTRGKSHLINDNIVDIS